jgi:ketosteroid isomerase-like protein
MQKIIINLVVSLATFIIGVTAATPWTAFRTAFDSQDKTEILKVEQQYLSAHINRDTATLDRVLADDFFISGYRGNVENKAERLALVEDSDRIFRSIDTSSVEVKVVSADRAYVTGKAQVRGSDHGRDFVSLPYNFIRTYERRNGQWQIVSVRCGRYCSSQLR